MIPYAGHDPDEPSWDELQRADRDMRRRNRARFPVWRVTRKDLLDGEACCDLARLGISKRIIGTLMARIFGRKSVYTQQAVGHAIRRYRKAMHYVN